ARLADAQARERAGQQALARNAVQTAAAQDRRDELARVAYESGGSGDLVSFFAVGSAHDLADRLHVVQEAGTHHEAVAQELRDARVVRLAEQARLEAARREIAQLTLQAKAAQARADAAHEQANARTAELTRLATQQRREQAAVDARRETEARRLASLQAESDSLTALLRERARAQAQRSAQQRAAGGRQKATNRVSTRGLGLAAAGRSAGAFQANRPPADSGARLSRPVNAPAGSPFGPRMHPILRYERLHTGLDFRAACGTPVYAADAGEVVRAGWAGGYGNQVVLAHADALATSYAHLESFEANSGWVQRGQLIGYSGTTGLSTGCHLHFEVRRNGVPLDPAGFL
ncbi:putative metalloendopeptidase, partial [Kineosphaera limosa NBRC 100340]